MGSFGKIVSKTGCIWNDQRELSRKSNCAGSPDELSTFSPGRDYSHPSTHPADCPSTTGYVRLLGVSLSSLTASVATTTPISTTKQPYGSGDTDDGYTLVFANIDEFQAWRNGEEERNCVEFVKVRGLCSMCILHIAQLQRRGIRTAVKQTRLVSRIIPSLYAQDTLAVGAKNMSKNTQSACARSRVVRST